MDKLQEALGTILELLTEAAQTVGTVAQRELPLLVQELLRFRFWEAIIWGAVWLIPVVFLIWTSVKLGAFRRSLTEMRDEDIRGISWVGQGALLVGASIMFAVASLPSFITAFKITIAPRLYLLEQVKEFMR